MSPEQAQRQRDLAVNEAALGLARRRSDELAPDGAAAAVLYRLQSRMREIEAAEAPGGQPHPAAGPEEEQIAAVMQEMAARGHGRL
jgi:hypothetical protein